MLSFYTTGGVRLNVVMCFPAQTDVLSPPVSAVQGHLIHDVSSGPCNGYAWGS